MSTSISQLADDDRLQLQAVVGAFVDAWNDLATLPVIAEYVEACGDSVRQSVLVELVKIDLEQRWQGGLRRLIEDYFEELPQLKLQVTPQLIFEEFLARKRAGDDVQASEYLERFPDLAVSVERLAALVPMLQSTAVDLEVTRKTCLSPGDTIDDFDLLLILGQGAFATVFLARQRSMQRIVAVKVSADKGNEPQTLAQLEHDNIVRVYDQRSVPNCGLRLLYMQYAAGGTLASVIQTMRTVAKENWNGQQFLQAIDQALDARGESASTESALRQKLTEMSWPEVVCWIAAQLGHALDYAHRRGVLHRDLKPANVLLTAAGIPKLADFNISFSAKLEGSSPVAYFGGSLAYMSPEQLEACNPRHDRTPDSLDCRSDLYSLGVLTWELLTGERPFPDEISRSGGIALLEEMTVRRRGGAPAKTGVQSREGSGLQDALCRCLAADPEQRFQTGLELAHELELCLQPEAKRLLSPATSGWKHVARRYPLVTVTMLTLIPNLIGAIFNFLYNHREILEHLPSAEPTFMRIQTIINLIAFPTGIMSASWLAGSVTKATRIDLRARLSPGALAEQRRRCLDLGNVAAIVGLVLWLIAAPAYPISLHLMLGSVPSEIYVQFVVSLTVCGLIAAAYPFFGVSVVAVRCFYPSLIDRETMTTSDRKLLQRLAKQTWLYLVLAASVPMIAIAILAVSQPERHSALVILASGGVIGYGIAVSAFRIVQADISTLVQAIWRDDR